MAHRRAANLLGAFALAVQDAQEAAASRVTEQGLSANAALVSIGHDPGLSIRALSRVLGLSHSACVRLVDGLVGQGLVRRHSADDRRAVALHLTTEGLGAHGAILSARGEALSALIGQLPKATAATLLPAIEVALGAITSSRVHADTICRLCDEVACEQPHCPVECAARALEGAGA
jgi:DNA-binding MarR family transcriptional regulator